jgi:hypothetical protein
VESRLLEVLKSVKADSQIEAAFEPPLVDPVTAFAGFAAGHSLELVLLVSVTVVMVARRDLGQKSGFALAAVAVVPVLL